MTTPSFRAVELLSAYLDGGLNLSDSARLESRLASDPDLRAVLNDLRVARGLLRQLPARKAPRRFILTPKMAGLRPPLPRAYPALRFASILTTLLFAVTFVVNQIGTLNFSLGAAAPSYGPYGFGGGAGAATEAVAEAPAAEPSTGLQISPTLEASADSARIAGTPTPEPLPKGFESEAPSANPIPFSWQTGLLIAALALASAAWFARFMNDRTWRAKVR